jgi:hypothetical protein
MSKYKIKFTKSTIKDIASSKLWYNNKQAFLGEEFITEIFEFIYRIENDTIDYPVRYNRIVRKINLHRFPYSIFFSKNIENKQIIIYAVLHQKRDIQQFISRFPIE